jgi:hypothetical protein
MMTRKLRMAILLALCLTAPVLTGCPVSKTEPNPDGINSCPTGCACTDNGQTYEVICGAEDQGGIGVTYQ